MTEQRNSGSTKRLIEVLENSRDRIFSNNQLAEFANVKVDSVNKLLNQLRQNQPDLRLEQPTRGSWVYRGWMDEASKSTKPFTVVAETRQPVKTAVTQQRAAALVVGDVCEIIGFSQDGTPIARDGNGKLYLLNQL